MKEKERSGAFADAHRKLSEAETWMTDVEAQVVTAAQAGMEAYKATKQCHNDQMQYATVTNLAGKNEVLSKVAIHFLRLDLMFLDVESKESNDESAPRPKGATSPLGDVDPPPVA